MQFNALITQISNNPLVKAAAATMLAEITNYGILEYVDRTMDRAAYSIAKRIVEQKNKAKEQL
jgi:hypothetical protein